MSSSNEEESENESEYSGFDSEDLEQETKTTTTVRPKRTEDVNRLQKMARSAFEHTLRSFLTDADTASLVQAQKFLKQQMTNDVGLRCVKATRGGAACIRDVFYHGYDPS